MKAMNGNAIVIVGSGMAGYTLAREVRKLDPDTPITMVTADDGALYSKPMLSTAMAQNQSADALVQNDAGAAALAIEVRAHTRVERIDRERRRIEVTGNDGAAASLAYGALVLATGASPRPYRVEDSASVPIATINSLEDYRRWRAALNHGDKVLLIGAGLIGVEFANDLAIAGHGVSLLDPAPQPLGRLLPEQLGALLGAALADAGVEVITGHAATALETADGGFQALLGDGRRIAFDKALSAIGLLPNVGLAAAAGLQAEQGIVVDAHLATSDSAIFAIGDCAQTAAGVLPFVLPLLAQARTLAKTLTGEPTRLRLPALPVVVKTPALPVVVCPPQAGSEGAWRLEGSGLDRRALFEGADGAPLGFALSGAMTKQRRALAREMPALLDG